MMDALKKMRYEKILDLMRRATANGTHREVAEVIAEHWNPPVSVLADGKMVIEDDALRNPTDTTGVKK